MENAVQKLLKIDQSIWLDNLSRSLINSGELRRWIEEIGARGITSNPTIFQKAISGSREYDSSLRKLMSGGLRDEKEIFLSLVMEDISRAADLLWPVYQQGNGQDGYVSLEVSPDLAYDPERTIAEARRLFSAIGKKNILIKVPATKEGIPAIEQLIQEGVNVNVTLLFSVQRYEQVAEAYIQGLEKRAQKGQPIQEIASVASFFVSRVDTLTDKLLQARISAAGSEAEKQKLKGLLGKSAVANAKIAYKKYQEIFSAKRFRSLPGAHIQRILWASTGTKDPSYSDVKYVEELIGPDSINTLPEATLNAFLEHGRVQTTITSSLPEAEEFFADLKSAGINIEQVTEQLENEGVKLFSDAFFLLLKEISQKRDSFLSRTS